MRYINYSPRYGGSMAVYMWYTIITYSIYTSVSVLLLIVGIIGDSDKILKKFLLRLLAFLTWSTRVIITSNFRKRVSLVLVWGGSPAPCIFYLFFPSELLCFRWYSVHDPQFISEELNICRKNFPTSGLILLKSICILYICIPALSKINSRKRDE